MGHMQTGLRCSPPVGALICRATGGIVPKGGEGVPSLGGLCREPLLCVIALGQVAPTMMEPCSP